MSSTGDPGRRKRPSHWGACSAWGCGGCPPTGPKKGRTETMKGHRLAVPVQWLRLGVVLLSAGLSGREQIVNSYPGKPQRSLP